MRDLVAALLLLTASCVRHPVADPTGGLASLPLAGLDGTPAERRARLVARIRADIAAAAPDAITPSLDRALAVVGELPREAFVTRAGRRFAYVDTAQLIGYRQTISDPHIVAVMTAALELRPNANVLEVGTGSGYQAAVLSLLAQRVSSIEIVAPLARAAARRLARYRNVAVRTGDGAAGWRERAPFDGIVVTAGAARIPPSLLDQLRVGGRLIMPIGANTFAEQLLVITKRPNGSLAQCSLGTAMFVPLTGASATPEARAALRDRTIPLCYSAPVT